MRRKTGYFLVLELAVQYYYINGSIICNVLHQPCFLLMEMSHYTANNPMQLFLVILWRLEVIL